MRQPSVIDNRNFLTRWWTYVRFHTWQLIQLLTPTCVPETEHGRVNFILELIQKTDKSERLGQFVDHYILYDHFRTVNSKTKLAKAFTNHDIDTILQRLIDDGLILVIKPGDYRCTSKGRDINLRYKNLITNATKTLIITSSELIHVLTGISPIALIVLLIKFMIEWF